jgi:hypothetical protein
MSIILVPCLTMISNVFMLDDVVIVLNHILHQIDDFALLLKRWLFILALLELSQHSLILQPANIILDLLYRLSLLYLSTKFS